jgi:hypothetical protein
MVTNIDHNLVMAGKPSNNKEGRGEKVTGKREKTELISVFFLKGCNFHIVFAYVLLPYFRLMKIQYS